VPPPLSIGTLTTAHGRNVKGFLVDAEATTGARDISGFGGWRVHGAAKATMSGWSLPGVELLLVGFGPSFRQNEDLIGLVEPCEPAAAPRLGVGLGSWPSLTSRRADQARSRGRPPPSQCQTAQSTQQTRSRGALARVGPSTPNEVGGAPTGAGAADRLARITQETHRSCASRGGPGRAGCPRPSKPEGRAPLGAPPWRFWAGGRASFSGISSGSVQRSHRGQVVVPGGRGPGPSEPAVTSRSRGTPLPAPPTGSSLEDAPR
jgi:hypothetical protein